MERKNASILNMLKDTQVKLGAHYNLLVDEHEKGKVFMDDLENTTYAIDRVREAIEAIELLPQPSELKEDNTHGS